MNAVSIPGSEELEVLSPSCIEIVQDYVPPIGISEKNLIHTPKRHKKRCMGDPLNLVLDILASYSEATRRLFLDRLRHFELWSGDQDDIPSPSFCTSPPGLRLTLDGFNVYQVRIHGGSSVKLGLEPATRR
ncbi:hypothetical protein AVEN_187879-1 [Araneus ventricosus]|uniref:Uncharacterized protein n=1 Tax=Araneus ventricosus TaxID=182803 RepID=A0A4Y2CVM5_ARAVE|nr:hypothetical protein AVEN_187879-1 [Araneus ventricosus]